MIDDCFSFFCCVFNSFLSEDDEGSEDGLSLYPNKGSCRAASALFIRAWKRRFLIIDAEEGRDILEWPLP